MSLRFVRNVLETFNQLHEFEQRCREDTRAFLSSAPDDLTAALSQFDDLFRRLYLFSCCHWGCHGKEHVFEHLAGRCVSSLASGWRLAESGYYDEALSLVRSVGEISNLLNLFWCDNREVRNWLDLPERERRERYRPAEVRNQLRQRNWLIPFDDAHYRRLCELAVHPTPETKPNAHQNSQRPVVGACFQAEGFSLATWELCWALALVAGPVAKLASFPESEAKAIVEVTVLLFELATKHVG